jgi:hypothetical protein
MTPMVITQADIAGYVTARAWELGFSGLELRGSCRSRELVAARAVIARELRLAPWELSLPAIGREFGGRDHSTIWVLLRGGKGKEAMRRQNTTARGKRAANGWCLACCKPVEPPYRSCPKCQERARQRYYEQREKTNGRHAERREVEADKRQGDAG